VGISAWQIVIVIVAIGGVWLFFRGLRILFEWAGSGNGPIGVLALVALLIFAFPVMATITISVGLFAPRQRAKRSGPAS